MDAQDDTIPAYSDAELKAEYVRLRAKWYQNPFYDASDIAKYVFRNQPNPNAWLQAVEIWERDLELQELISDKVNGHTYGEQDTSKQAQIARFLAIYNDPKADHKVKVSALIAISSIEGQIVKASEKKVESNKTIRRLVLAIDHDADKLPLPSSDGDEDENEQAA